MTFGHLSARELVDLWPDGGTHPHLAGCQACRAEYDDLATVFLAARDAGDGADAYFTPERLAAQEAQILRRLENAERPARVLRFPPAMRPLPVARAGARRWIAAAAAAGLLTGIFAGRAFDFAPTWRHIPATPERVSAARDRAATVAAPSVRATTNDERLLRDIEAALVEPPVDELRAIDAFTPRVREATFSR
jgi:hypothetical protein